MYHSISRSSTPPFRPFTVTPEDFEAQLAHIAEQGWQTVTVTQFLTQPLPPKPVVLTFDDGFADFYSAALPLLQRYGCTATLYVTTGFVGGTSRWLAGAGEGDRPMLSWAQIADIGKSGIEIGAHSHTHLALDKLPPDPMREEIFRPKHLLEDQLQQTVASFAYPFGYHSRAVRQMVRDAGYSSACAVRYAFSSPRDDPFTLARHIVRRDTRIDQFSAIIAGHPPLFPLMIDRIRSGMWMVVRRVLRGLPK